VIDRPAHTSNPEHHALEVRSREIRAGLKAILTADVVDEHRRHPKGHHSPALALVLAYLRQAPVAGKLVAYASVPGREWRIFRLSGQPGVPPDVSDPRTFDSEDKVAHEIFLIRLDELGVSGHRKGARGG
jgi:branched-chain amino acid transport system permease protein